MDDSVFVSGLPDSVTEAEIESFFGAIGVIKVIVFFIDCNIFSLMFIKVFL